MNGVNDANDVNDLTDQDAPAPINGRPARNAAEFRAHMRRANSLVAERRLADAEQEIAKALEGDSDDLQALKLLALVRFRLGRLEEAGEAYRKVTAAAPGDAAARMNLGLIALKLERFEEAAAELETALRLRPDDQRAQSYLSYALGRLAPESPEPEPVAAPAVSARAGKSEWSNRPELDIPAVTVGSAVRPSTPTPVDPRSTLTSFALERLLVAEDLASSGADASSPWAAPQILRLPVSGEAIAHAGSLLSAAGQLAVTPARGRRRGRETDALLSSEGQPFYRCRGQGELWLVPPRRGATLSILQLEEDVLFLRRELVAAFTGDLVWDTGSVPCTRLAVLHFHGNGSLVVDWRGADVVALRLSEGQPMLVAEGRILGWIGRLVAQADPGVPVVGSALVACEGEGVLLIARHGQAGEPVHQRTEPGDDGSGPSDPLRPAVHR
jgi:tetratricopeptide (TPR) repeat protein